MAFVAPLAAAEGAAATGAATAASSGAAGAGAGAAGRGAAGKAASRAGASSRGAAASGAAGSAPRRRARTKPSTGVDDLADATDLPFTDSQQESMRQQGAAQQGQQGQEQTDQRRRTVFEGLDDSVANSKAYLAAQKARPSQQVAGGLLAALVVYPILLNFLQGGSPQVKRWLKAKAFNVTSTPGAASTTVKPKRNPSSGGTIGASATGLTSGTGATSPPSSSSTGSAAGTAIAFARSKIGLPYGWGQNGGKDGNGPYDCSGLTSKAYAAAGISIGRTTLQQIFAGTEVKRADLQPGDLVFAHPRHVAIYTGNGRIVEAPRTGLNVREVPIWGFWRARRVT